MIWQPILWSDTQNALAAENLDYKKFLLTIKTQLTQIPPNPTSYG